MIFAELIKLKISPIEVRENIKYVRSGAYASVHRAEGFGTQRTVSFRFLTFRNTRTRLNDNPN
jgi:hypothetical protein